MLPLSEAKQQLTGLLSGERDLIANAANFSAFLNEQLDDINWLGFYFLQGEELVLGPFQGRPACVRIPVGKGVCGAAVAQGATQVVPDVHAFPGHIACDVRSRSEVVVPLWQGAVCTGVLDIDSPTADRFSAADVTYVETLAKLFCQLQYGKAR
ncbi:GAF domain-containing protein [Parahaliea aestuarii]|uniref:GAF domain-containing protein n=1 Tax=Parahaliea aestuarii TaxID=1852021 RepID=A0A5C8ZL03_9GAMM|nr:GAF domain-containing protein [Parahaliea aestuarii]TXS89128.1 GAF domain-containing protein [Parahaliea aestuarii]